ncbi:MAG: heme-dependent oxidative N-demethylase subunit alpha family protein, partial [Gammaproteobacteria bacterium]
MNRIAGDQVNLSEPIRYFPVSSNPFEFKAGLRKLPLTDKCATDQVLQIDRQWHWYRTVKLNSRSENFNKYVCEHNLDNNIASRVVAFLINQLVRSYPNCFELVRNEDDATLICHLSGEALYFDNQLRLIDIESTGSSPIYQDALDALACQIQEDFSITRVENERDQLCYLHLCLPNYWAARD